MTRRCELPPSGFHQVNVVAAMNFMTISAFFLSGNVAAGTGCATRNRVINRIFLGEWFR